MPQTHTTQIEIRAPARRVFELISDPQSLIGGFPMITRVEHSPTGPMRRGTRLRFFISKGEGEDEGRVEAEVTEFAPPRVVEFAGSMTQQRGQDRAVSRYEIEQFGAVSKLKVTSRMELDSWYWRLLWPITRMFIGWAAARQLKQLKEAAERSAT